MSSIKKAVNIIGGQTKLARHLETHQTAVWNWVHRHGQAPAKYIQRIAALTNNEVTVDQLLADHEKNQAKDSKEGIQQ
ncbi:MAG: helix-turn-helix domain-containing protein [Gammaproteobacteria bacterium]|uniref:Putative antitoxin n=1 Tax=viral metagenome TaxID=1070528 RepID=A0A6M3KR66_9ZZZZ|nr:helix-turn-helix domain-containing protein [Shewanella baltica]MBU1391151.1 helix-turn-helix domain-containing protein [Gammaproteobacteria bacterium]MBU1479271.1 helix-turn-helix domain-containing protein [Gammaproteobacteria bacterium]MBU2002272.1 helix-turn-helix domain-containing protein [Gammaproteobacteria bacterium]MBU2132145.1 helix-turn-helix domain-containing protein [Gammaproteobacteria bacterium]MBU2189526.1 helix-turn-helix domain-containing protein [Gammaproteobacteria bacteri